MGKTPVTFAVGGTRHKLSIATDHMTMLEQNPERVRRYFGDPKVVYAAS